MFGVVYDKMCEVYSNEAFVLLYSRNSEEANRLVSHYQDSYDRGCLLDSSRWLTSFALSLSNDPVPAELRASLDDAAEQLFKDVARAAKRAWIEALTEDQARTLNEIVNSLSGYSACFQICKGVTVSSVMSDWKVIKTEANDNE